MAGLIAPATREQIRSASDIVDVIGAYLPLKRAGANFVTLCPFHKEKSPSFNVNPHKQIFHCFGCHKGGDVFTFVKEYENITFVEAVRRLADRAHIPLEFDNTPGQQQARYLKETLLEIHEQVTQRWQNALANDAAGQVARDYLQKRGLSDEALKLFRLGYAPEVWDDTVNWAKSRNYEPKIVEQAGLILRKEASDHYYDRFRGRLIFPICDEQGRVIGFSGRILSGDEKVAKYENSPETPIFTKGRVFYGLDKSKRAILDTGFAIVCEGQIDLIACYMAGVKNVVAPQGTAFTPEHARILKRYVDEVVLCFDSDTAGQTAAVRILDSLLVSDLAVRVASMPSPHDPDSYIKAFGSPAFEKVIADAQGFFDFYLDRLCSTQDLGSDKGRGAVVKAMGEALLKTGNAVLADTYAQRTAQRLAVSAESVRAEFKKGGRPQRVEEEMPEAAASAGENETRPSEREFWLLRFLLLSDDHVDWMVRHFDLRWIEHAVVREIISARLSAFETGTWQGVPALVDQFEADSARNLITQAVAEDHSKENLEKKITSTVQELRNDFCDRQLSDLTRRLGQLGVSEEDLREIVSQQTYLRQTKRRPIEPMADA